ncbi:T9SS type A sorting domain-containing protein, partial [Muricauda sp. 2012CJ35-5]
TIPGSNQAPVVTNPGTQNSNEGEVVSLQINATDESTNLTYQANNLPPTLSINPNTGLISGSLAQAQPSGSFIEENGLLIIEAESSPLVPNWSLTNLDDETGIIAGSNHFNDQNGGTIPYEFTITTPGVYRFLWHSFYSGTVSSEENDNWLRFPNTGGAWFFGYQGTPASEAALITELEGDQNNIVFPIGSARVTPATTPEGSGGNGFFKIFLIGGNSQQYSWQANTSDNDSHHIYVRFENPGTYTFEISERSAGHAIDRIALFKVDGPSYSGSELNAFPESNSSGGTAGAAANSPYNVSVTVSDDNVPQESTTIQFDWVVGTDTGGGGGSPSQSVESFTLINADSNTDLFTITDGQQIDQASIQGIGLNIRANTNPSVVGSVSFNLSGPVNESRTENGAPYALFGDSGGNYNSTNLPLGSYTLSATPFSNASLGGDIGQALSIQFAIINGGAARSFNGENDSGIGGFNIALSPNPTASDVHVVTDLVEPVEKVYLFDMSGRLVKTVDIDVFESIGGTFDFSILGLEEGIYVVQIWSPNLDKVSEEKLIIRK